MYLCSCAALLLLLFQQIVTIACLKSPNDCAYSHGTQAETEEEGQKPMNDALKRLDMDDGSKEVNGVSSAEYYDMRLMSSVAGTYVLQGILLNALFTSIASISQEVQQILGIDTGSVVLGKLSGILTVTIGGYASYKASERLLKLILVRITALGLFKDGKKVIEALGNRNDYSITLPSRVLALVGNKLRNSTACNRGMKKMAALIAPVATDIVAKRNVTVTRIRDQVHPIISIKPAIKEMCIISLYCMSTFLLLGGRLHSFTPSDISHPGAFAVPSFSLAADGYKYADRQQKQIIQEIGRKYGCHTCGHISRKEKYIADHQPPSGVIRRKLNGRITKFLLEHRLVPESLVRPRQFFYPHCSRCSAIQAKAIRNNRKVVITHSGALRPYYLCASGYLIGRSLLDTKWLRMRRRGIKRF